MSYRLLTDEDVCIACKACEVHCKVWNRVPAGLKLGVLLGDGPRMGRAGTTTGGTPGTGDAGGSGTRPVMRTLYMPCQHCDDAPCLGACPTGAMRRRGDGIVYVESGVCTGCRACLLACPWQVPQFDAAAGKMRKCDFCRDRLDQGLLPACVTGCTTKALRFEKI